MGRLYPMICRKSKLSLPHKVTLYKTCIRPMMTYVSVVFAHHPHSSYKSLQVLQNKFMRMATGNPWFVRNVDLYRDLDLPAIAQCFKKSYFEKAVRHPNPLVVVASTTLPPMSSSPGALLMASFRARLNPR
ncbi:jg21725 [Pararge aegeria aegeria]|uniref:Jg21725 protein n=1 Tax=Pararge aegeria aegeria TaxID=348720 RepID=A0A8S4S3K0_9NEOP|nr:jg21725 [Pararge aegeria aegeria]